MNKKIGIITLNPSLPVNVGNVLQAFALQSKIKELLPTCDCIITNQKTLKCSDYFKSHCNFTNKDIDTSYDMIVAGSDQIWYNGCDVNKYFLLKYPNKIKKIFYAASFGNHNHKWELKQINEIHNSLKDNTFISCREFSGTFLTKKWFNLNSIAVLDPTMLYDANFYLESINEKRIENEKGIFAYILDNTDKKDKFIKGLIEKTHEPVLHFDGTVENFIHNFNSAKYILTDSYHGSVFSLIFNKPFICIRNFKRGNDRFDDLCLRFTNLDNRFIKEDNKINLELLSQAPNVKNEIENYKILSLNFLKNSLI